MQKTKNAPLILKDRESAKDVLTIGETPINSKQILHIMQQTPKSHIYKRPAKGGGEWDYVTGVYVKKVLNYAFGWLWNFEIKEHGKDGETYWVLGKLTVTVGDKQIIKEQFGRADIKMKKDKSAPLDIGNDRKAAATDALKKCAAELGIAGDVYGANEFKEIKVSVVKELEPPKETDAKDTAPTKSKIMENLKQEATWEK